MTLRGPRRSSNCPSFGEATATASAANPKPRDIASRLQPNSWLTGFKKTPNVKTTSEPKPAITPKKAAPTTSHPEDLPATCFGDLVDHDRVRSAADIGFAGRRDALAGKRHEPFILTFRRHGFRDRPVNRAVVL